MNSFTQTPKLNLQSNVACESSKYLMPLDQHVATVTWLQTMLNRRLLSCILLSVTGKKFG